MCQRGMSVQELPDLIIFTDTINIDVVHIFLITCIFSKTLYFLLNALKKNLDIFNETQISCRITSQMNVCNGEVRVYVINTSPVNKPFSN